MKQRAFPFQLPDGVLLEILGEIHKYNLQKTSLQEWFYSVMLLLDEEADIHFGDLVVNLPHFNGNGAPGDLEVLSYKGKEICRYSGFPNAFIAHLYDYCNNKKTPDLTEIQLDRCPVIPDLPYCPVVIPLGCQEYHLGAFAAGSYNDRAVIMRNRKLFKILGVEMSRFLFATHMNRVIAGVLFEHKEDSMSFESLLTFKFRQLMEKIDPETGGNIMGNIIPLVEKILIQLALEKTGHRLGQSASLLGINRNTLRKKIQSLGIESKES